jgi:hypothetical protein
MSSSVVTGPSVSTQWIHYATGRYENIAKECQIYANHDIWLGASPILIALGMRPPKIILQLIIVLPV